MSSQRESKLWKELKANLAAARLSRIDALDIPDVNLVLRDCRAGWIELKAQESWPVRKTTKSDFGLKSGQAIWLDEYARAGGSSYILVKCDEDYMLFDGLDAHKVRRGVTKQEAFLLSKLHCPLQMDWKKLEEVF